MKNIIFTRPLYNLLTALCLLSFSATHSSCIKEDIQDMDLSGDISKYVPDYSIDFDYASVGGAEEGVYFLVAPDIRANFEMWGLYIKQIDYYLNDKLIGTCTDAPFAYSDHFDTFETNSYKAKAVITIGGKKCDDYTFIKEKNISIQTSFRRPLALFMDYNYVSSGEIFNFTPVIIKDQSSPTAEITKVNYKFGDESIDITTSPFTFSRVVTEPDESSIPFTANITYRDSSSATSYSYGFSTSIKVGGEMYRHSAGFQSSNRFYKNNQILPLYAKVYPGKGYVNSVFRTTFQLDGKEIASTTDFQFLLNYPLSNLSQGVHVLRIAFESQKDGSGKQIQYNNEYFVITD